MNSRFVRFLKVLLVIAAVINLLFLFVFDYKIPSEIHLPFGLPDLSRETAGEEPAEEETEPEEAEPEKEPEKEPEEETAEVIEEEPEETVEEEMVQRCIIISKDGSNVRSGPGIDYEVITAYAYNTVLVITGEPENGWYPIQAEDGTTGYIFETQINMLEEEDQTETEEQSVETEETDQAQEQTQY